MRRMLMGCLLVLGVTGCAARPTDRDIAECLRQTAVPAVAGSGGFGKLDDVLCSARVVALGEATHGQHEAFELKRALTMHMIRACGVRLVVYEAASSRARACDDYINGRTDDLSAAMRGFGMSVWMVEENAALLDDLRRWNAGAAPADRVRFIGMDVQDPEAAAKRLAELLGPERDDLVRRVLEIPPAIEPAAKKLWAGDPAEFYRVAELAKGVREEVERSGVGEEAVIRAVELAWGIEMFRSAGGRDLAMAEMVKEELRRAGPSAKAVVWAHNEHIKRGRLTYLGSDDLALGGHLAAALGPAGEGGYYALGFVFAEGCFHALAQDDQGKWMFKEYRVTSRPAGSIAEPFLMANAGEVVVDLRSLPRTGAVGVWLNTEHANIWFGGYRVPDDLEAMMAGNNPMLACVPVRDFDGLAFLRTTTVSRPFQLRK